MTEHPQPTVFCVACTGGLDKADVLDSAKGSRTTAVVPGNGITAVNSWQANGAIPAETAYHTVEHRPAWVCPVADAPSLEGY